MSKEANSFIACQAGGHYGDSCRDKGYIQSGQAFIIDWKSFKKFMDMGITNKPIFVFDSYGEAVAKAKELNEQTQHAHMKFMLANEQAQQSHMKSMLEEVEG